MDKRASLQESVPVWLGVGGVLAALSALPLGVGAAQRVGNTSLWNNGWFRLGMVMAAAGALSLLWALVLFVAHHHVQIMLDRGTPVKNKGQFSRRPWVETTRPGQRT